jgi:LmbE family N-acetylglucosaminyl deacetylase
MDNDLDRKRSRVGTSLIHCAQGGMLILAPHVDDEVLGCHSFLVPGTTVCYFGIEDRPTATADERREEVAAAAARKGFAWMALDFTVNRYACADLIGSIERVVNSARPRRVLIPHASYNQDHRAVHDAAITALRPHDRNWFVPEVLVYEEPDVLWPHAVSFEPNFFVPLDIADKLRTYGLYRSQVRGHRPPALLRALARVRGAQANLAYAEAFACRRRVVAPGNPECLAERCRRHEPLGAPARSPAQRSSSGYRTGKDAALPVTVSGKCEP